MKYCRAQRIAEFQDGSVGEIPITVFGGLLHLHPR